MRTSLLLLAQSRSPPLDCGGLGGTLGISRPRGVFMFKRTRDLLTFANVCSFLALAVAISTGGAYAANTVFSTDIVNGEVKTQDLAANAVTSPKILDGGVKATDITNDAVSSNTISDGGVQTADLADGGVTGHKGADVSGSVSFAAGAVANGRCRDFSVTTSGTQVGDAVLMSLRGAVADGIVFSGVRVAVNNQSIIKMCNFTGGASPAITSLPVRLVTFD